MKKRSTIRIDIDGRMHEHMFMALYAGLKMIQEAEKKQEKEGMFSLVGAEAYCLIEDLKKQFPGQMKIAQADTEHYYPHLKKQPTNDTTSK